MFHTTCIASAPPPHHLGCTLYTYGVKVHIRQSFLLCDTKRPIQNCQYTKGVKKLGVVAASRTGGLHRRIDPLILHLRPASLHLWCIGNHLLRAKQHHLGCTLYTPYRFAHLIHRRCKGVKVVKRVEVHIRQSFFFTSLMPIHLYTVGDWRSFHMHQRTGEAPKWCGGMG